MFRYNLTFYSEFKDVGVAFSIVDYKEVVKLEPN